LPIEVNPTPLNYKERKEDYYHFGTYLVVDVWVDLLKEMEEEEENWEAK